MKLKGTAGAHYSVLLMPEAQEATNIVSVDDQTLEVEHMVRRLHVTPPEMRVERYKAVKIAIDEPRKLVKIWRYP